MKRQSETGARGHRATVALPTVLALVIAQPACAQPEYPQPEYRQAGSAPEGSARTTPARAANYRLEIDAPGELLEPLRTQTLVGRWRTEPDFEAAQLPLFVDRAREEALAIAQAAGFFSAKVTVTQAPRAAGDASALPVIRIAIDAGARTTVNRLEFELRGEAAADGLEPSLRDAWPLPEGSFFRSARWELGKRQLLEQLQQRGFLRAHIAESSARVDPVATTASLHVVVDSGPRLRFGDTTIRGMSRYPESIVEALIEWDKGDPYAYDTVMAVQDRLRADGHFTSVTILPDIAAVEADPEREDVPVSVEVRERQVQRATFGLGYSTDKGVRGLAGYDHYNVLGRGWTADTGVVAETVDYRVFANLRTPYGRDGHYYRAGARAERLDVSGELTDTDTLYVGRGKSSRFIETFVSLQFQNERSSVDSDDGPITSRSKALTLGYSWVLRRVDSRIDPRDGYTLNAQISGASDSVGSDRSFVRLWGRATKFWPMPEGTPLEGGMLVGLVEAGWVFAGARDGIPSGNLFRTGGAHTIRGYDFLSLGVPEGNATVGGRVLALASLEYQHPIRDDWYGAVFMDVGNAADRWQDFRAVRGTGVGVRWRSPVGPLKLDVAYGSDVHDWRVHFSVGYTF